MYVLYIHFIHFIHLLQIVTTVDGWGNGRKKTRSGRVLFLAEKKSFLIRSKLYKIKTSFGADYFYANFSESVSNFESGYHSNIFAAFSETDFLVANNLITKVGFRFSKNYLLDQSSIAPRLALAYKVTKNQLYMKISDEKIIEKVFETFKVKIEKREDEFILVKDDFKADHSLVKEINQFIKNIYLQNEKP